MPFDPAAGFEVVEEGGGAAVAEAPSRFDPSAGFEIVEEGGEKAAPSRFDPAAGFEMVEQGPTGTLADFMAQEDAGTVETGALSRRVPLPVPEGNLAQPFPRTEEEAVEMQVPAGDEPARIGEAPATVPRFGEPGTIARGVSDTMGGLAEWAMNSPAEAAATFTMVGPAIAARYLPEIAVHFAKDWKAGLQGDREALGRALAMTALVGGPSAFRGAKGAVAKRGAAKDAAMERVEAAVERAAPVEELPVKPAEVLPGAAGVFERVVGEKPATVEPATATMEQAASETTKGAERASEIAEAATVHGDVLRVGEEARTAQEGVPVEAGGAGVRPPGEVATTTTAKAKEAAAPEAKITVEEFPDGFKLAGLEVPPEGRGKGVGSAAVRKLIERADKEGKPIITTAHAVTPADQSALNRFYERLGFKHFKDDPLSKKPMYRYDPPTSEPPPVPPAEPPAMPPATPTEGPVPQTIGVKVAAIDAQRADRGLPPVEPVLRRSHEEYYERAMERLEREPDAREKVLAELAEKPRALTPEEVVLVDHKLVDLTNQRDAAVWEGIKAADRGDSAGVKLYEARVGEMGAQLGAVEAVVGRGDAAAGTLAGRALEARKMMLREDFSLAGLERRMRAANEFRQLSAAELTELRRTAEEFRAKNEALEARLKEQTEMLARAETRAELAKLKEMEARGQAAVRGRVKEVVEKVGKVLDARADAARERLRGKLLSLSPADLKDLAEIGAANIYHVGVDFARWSERMVKELGERVKPYLDEVWKESQRVMDEAVRGEAGAGMDKGPRPAGAPRTPREKAAARDVEAAKEAIERRLRRRIEEYEGRIARSEFKRAPKAPPPSTPEIRRLQFELDQVKERFYERMFEESLKSASRPEKILRGGAQLGHMFRNVITSGEFSGVLRQGKLITFGHPVRTGKALPEMFQATFSEQKAFEALKEIKERPNSVWYRLADLFIGERTASLAKAEEAYVGSWADKLPLGAGAVVRGSRRAYVTFLNRIRADSFDAMAAVVVKRSGELTLPQAKVIANFVNVFTGRGKLGVKAEHAAEALAALFFAPRFVASRFQAVLGQPIYYGVAAGKGRRIKWNEGNAAMARKLVVGEYVRTLIGASVYYTLVGAAGYQIGGMVVGSSLGEKIISKLTSSDLGKIVIGKTRLDPLAGLQQVTVLLSRLATGQSTSTQGKVTDLRSGKYGEPTMTDVGARFLRTKLAPVPGTFWSWWTGRDVLDRPYGTADAIRDLTVSITYRDIFEVLKENGLPTGTALQLLAIFGEGLSVHGEIGKGPR